MASKSDLIMRVLPRDLEYPQDTPFSLPFFYQPFLSSTFFFVTLGFLSQASLTTPPLESTFVPLFPLGRRCDPVSLFGPVQETNPVNSFGTVLKSKRAAYENQDKQQCKKETGQMLGRLGPTWAACGMKYLSQKMPTQWAAVAWLLGLLDRLWHFVGF